MNLEEANARLKKAITEEQLESITYLYILLDLEKDDFCRIVDAVGIESLLKRTNRFKRLLTAEEDLTAKERYLWAKKKIADMKEEKADLYRIINDYERV